LKLGATMHDTCATANAVPRILEMLKEESGKSHYGEEGWAQQSDDVRKMLDQLCANHSRNLPEDAFNRLFKAYLLKELGSDFEACQKASGSRARFVNWYTRVMGSMRKEMGRRFLTGLRNFIQVFID
jgi:hypothetical protein